MKGIKFKKDRQQGVDGSRLVVCRKCGQHRVLDDFNMSQTKYVVGGEVKAIYETRRHICKDCQFPKGWHLKYQKVLMSELKS